MMQLPERTINAQTKVTVRRMLPVAGEVLVQRGQPVEALTPIAKAEVPRRYHIIDVARQLGRPQVDMEAVMLKAVGDSVQANEVVAHISGGLPFLQRKVRAPVAGQITTVGSGWVLLETERVEVELLAFINGLVSRIIPDRGVILEASGAMIEAACGFGGEAYGLLKRMVDTSADTIAPESINDSLKNCILLAGRTVTEEILYRAEEAEVKGLIVGSIDAALLKLDPPSQVRVVATEGFGDIPMSDYTFGLLGTLDSREISIRGHTPHVLASMGAAPEDALPVIMATSSKASSLAALAKKEVKPSLEVGSRVRVVRGPHFGTSGVIKALPPNPLTNAAGLIAPSAHISLPNDAPYIPLANLEQIV
ncbi:MAG: hypothetical protein U0401_07530 [Anaerolineae bacterium]